MAIMLKIFFHLLPLIGIFYQKYYLTIALLLLVALPYIKIKKIEEQLKALPQDSNQQREDLKVSLRRVSLFVFGK